jgi:5-methylthioribose kinase
MMNEKQFYQITEENAIDYVIKTPTYSKVLKSATDLKCEDLALGNINLIFRIFSESDPKNSLILKQALSYAKKYPEFKVPQERASLEADILKIENKYCPGAAPELYAYDPKMFINLMEDANEHLIMRDGLMQQILYPKFSNQIGVFLARTLFYTSDFFVPSDEKKAMVVRFTNPVMCKVTEDLIFTQPWMVHPSNHWTEPYLDKIAEALQTDESTRLEALSMKEIFMTHAQALIHGDLHTGSIMINPEETVVIDPEFGYYGPMGFDIGAVLGNLVLSYASQEYHAKDEKIRSDYQAWILETIKNVWVEFEKEFRTLWNTKRLPGEWESKLYLDRFLLNVLQDSVGFGGCKITRRLFGLAHVPDMWEIPDDRIRAKCESAAFNAGKQWLLQRKKVTCADDMVRLVKEYAKPDKSLE